MVENLSRSHSKYKLASKKLEVLFFFLLITREGNDFVKFDVRNVFITSFLSNSLLHINLTDLSHQFFISCSGRLRRQLDRRTWKIEKPIMKSSEYAQINLQKIELGSSDSMVRLILRMSRSGQASSCSKSYINLSFRSRSSLIARCSAHWWARSAMIL